MYLVPGLGKEASGRMNRLILTPAVPVKTLDKQAFPQDIWELGSGLYDDTP